MSASAILRIKPLGFPWETQDPFLFCVYHKDDYPEGNGSFGPVTPLDGRNIGQDFTIKDGFRMYHGETIPGFPAHPHRGFETITVVREGLVDHSDSMGASGRYGHGDVQWMTAGKGIQHAEMFPLLKKHEGNPLDLFQIWLNLPKAKKFTEPYFTMLWQEDIPKVKFKDKNGKVIEILVIAGDVAKKKAPKNPPESWAHDPLHEVAVWTIKVEAGGAWEMPLASADVHRTLYFYEGDHISIGDKKIESGHFVDLKPNEEVVVETGNQDGHFLVLQGKPIGEPVVQYGPFVMNTRQEIQEAYEDYQATRFGGWPWPSHDNVHGPSKGRFAIYPDGHEEVKG